MSEVESTSVFEMIGGAAAIEASMEIFNVKLLENERVRHFFDNVDMEKKKSHQRAFLTMVLGGPSNYTGRNMKDAHAHLDIDDEDYETVRRLLIETLTELEIPEDIKEKVNSFVSSIKDDIVTVK